MEWCYFTWDGLLPYFFKCPCIYIVITAKVWCSDMRKQNPWLRMKITSMRISLITCINYLLDKWQFSRSLWFRISNRSNSELCGAGGYIPVSKDCKQHSICDRCGNQLHAFHEKPIIVAHLVSKFPAFYGTWRFYCLVTRAHLWTVTTVR